LVSYILRGLGHSAELQVYYVLLELLDYVFEFCYLLWNSFFGLYFNACHREKCSVNHFLNLEFLYEQMFLLFMQLGFFFIKPLLQSKFLAFNNTALL